MAVKNKSEAYTRGFELATGTGRQSRTDTRSPAYKKGFESIFLRLDRIATNEKVKQTAPNKHGKRRTCGQGVPCGNSCISGKYTCRKTPSPNQIGAIKSFVGADLEKHISDRVNAQVAAKLKEAGLSPDRVKSSLAELNPKDIAVDPKRFQYKLIGEHTSTGEVGSLSGVGRYDENLGGILQVWRDPGDGKTYVVNGHNRLALANKLGAEKVAVRYLDVRSPEEARAIGALTNIAEGRGDAIDAAKFFKDTGLSKRDLEAKGIPMREKVATDGLALSALDNSLFRKTIDGEIPLERATIIGGSGLSGEKQRSLYELVNKRKNVTNETLSELVDTVKSAGTKQETQFDLFGGSTVEKDLAIEKAGLQASIKKRLSREKKLFSTVGKSTAARELERGGNIINTGQSSKIASEADTVLRAFDQLKNYRGEVGTLLNKAAERIANGENSKKVQDEIYGRVREAVGSEISKTFGGSKK